MKTALLALFVATCLSSCAIDSVGYGAGVNSVSYPTHRIFVPPVYHTGRHTSYHYDLRPDYMRYGSRCVQVRRPRQCHR